MKTARQLLNAVGIDTIQDGIGVEYGTINRAANIGEIPSSWFGFIESVCIEKHIECPRSLFNFKGTAE